MAIRIYTVKAVVTVTGTGTVLLLQNPATLANQELKDVELLSAMLTKSSDTTSEQIACGIQRSPSIGASVGTGVTMTSLQANPLDQATVCTALSSLSVEPGNYDGSSFGDAGFNDAFGWAFNEQTAPHNRTDDIFVDLRQPQLQTGTGPGIAPGACLGLFISVAPGSSRTMIASITYAEHDRTANLFRPLPLGF